MSMVRALFAIPWSSTPARLLAVSSAVRSAMLRLSSMLDTPSAIATRLHSTTAAASTAKKRRRDGVGNAAVRTGGEGFMVSGGPVTMTTHALCGLVVM